MKPFRSSPDAQMQLTASPSWSHCEGLIKSFEEAWRSGRSPTIQEHLLSASDVRPILLLELVHIDLEFRLKSGAAARVEDYYSEYPELAGDPNVLLELLEAEYQFRRRADRTVTVSEYVDRFPHLRAALEERLASTQPKTIIAASGPAPNDPHVRPEAPGYELIEPIGRGGMGIVFKAREPNLDRLVAIKFLSTEYAPRSDRLERFLREARTASGLNHPHICTIHALSEHEGRPYIVMELVEGETLRAAAGRRAPFEDVISWIEQAARALTAAHAAGVVHRDIKPENLMLRADGYVKVLDFGLARRLPSIADPSAPPAQDTGVGTLMGTVGYMSPEQTRGAAAEAASDVFSLGIVLYELLTSRNPFAGESPIATLHAIASTPVIAPARLNPAVPAALDGLVMAMLNKDPQLRPSSAEVQSRLESLRGAYVTEKAAKQGRSRVHRDAELAALRNAFQQAEAGRGGLVCLRGEPGIGKTTLVEDFLAEIEASRTPCLVARGHCSERLGDAEAYLPVVDALENLIRGDDRGAATRTLSVLAPSWYAQVVPDASTDAPALTGSRRAGSQQAMLREFGTFIQQASRLATVVLFIDDVHWADLSTVDLLAHVGRQCHDLRVLTVVTYRPTEMLLGPHPFRGVQLELQGRGVCTELEVGFLARREIDDYLSLLFPGHAFPAELAELIYARTEGSPLFMADLVRFLREQGVLEEIDGRWTVARELPDLLRELPESVRGMIERKLDRLDGEDRRLLTAAAVLGSEFESLVIADALDRDPAWVEERLQLLDRVHGLVRSLRPHELPDGGLSVRFAFVHILYQQALYHQLPPTRRSQWSLALARAMEERLGGAANAVNTELACLYEVGRDHLRAAKQFFLAAQHAAKIYAHGEAIGLARRGIGLVATPAESPERVETELLLQTTLGLQLQVTQGFGSPAAETAYLRGRELCRGGAAELPLFPVVWGLWLINKVRSELSAAQVLANELAVIARKKNDPNLALQAHQALGMTALCRGDQETALQHVEQAAALYDPKLHRAHAFQFGQDPGVICKVLGAVTLWLLGYPDAAARQSAQGIRICDDLSPSSQATAYYFAAMVHQLRREHEIVKKYAATCHAIACEHGYSFWRTGSSMLLGWAAAAAGEVDAGIARMRQALADWQAIGSVTYRTYYLGILAETLLQQGRFDEAMAAIDEALVVAERTGERFFEAELHRLRGVCRQDDATAEAFLRRAIQVAQRQKTRTPELRGVMSLLELQRAGGGDDAEVARQLRLLTDWFMEGGETVDVRGARAMLRTG